MDTQTHKASLQLLTEHFGFVPTDFVDDVINSINELVHEAIRQLETFLSQHQDDDSLNALSKIETLLENAIDRNFDKFELYCLNNIFIVPKSNLLLPRYTNLHLQDQLLFDGDEDKEIHDLHAQILAEKYYTKNIQIQLNQTNEKLDKITCIKSQLESSFTGDHDLSKVIQLVDSLTRKVAGLRSLANEARMITRDGKFKQYLSKIDDSSMIVTSAIRSYMDRQKTGRYVSENSNLVEFGQDYCKAVSIGNPDDAKLFTDMFQ